MSDAVPVDPALVSAPPPVKVTADDRTVTDSTGRTIRFRVMDPGDMLDVLEMAGPSSSNQGYMQYAAILFSVTDIDNVPVPQPTNRAEMKALARRVGNEGMVALAQRMFGTGADSATTKAAQDAETAKN